ncbi:hypothetical protein [Ramlibacter alkalitolerans]|uniref:Peptidase M48 domain-containing protein n=1 Tax=Ramlibacter alkalitolerans TaxID=2039631 RepID=A0ABS1JTQ8_9BURK|nr:hypothetical protein [Ramlibacter alkalitolerans]MBL0427675.1 hypothetical protein [Ramlibacter alkalitolerans]
MNAFDTVKNFFSGGPKVEVELRGEPVDAERPVARNSLRVLGGLAFAVTLGALGSMYLAHGQTVAGKVAGGLDPVESAIAVAKSIPAPWTKKLMMLDFQVTTDAENEGGYKAIAMANKLGYAMRCQVHVHPDANFLDGKDFDPEGLSTEHKLEFVLLHETAHCYSGEKRGDVRQDIPLPDGYVQRPSAIAGLSNDQPLPEAVSTLASESEADVAAIVWMAKRHPELKDSIAQTILRARQHEQSMNEGGISEHYTAAAVNFAAEKLAKLTPDEVKALSADNIRDIAYQASLQSVKNFRDAVVPLRTQVSRPGDPKSNVYIVTRVGGVWNTQLVAQLSGAPATPHGIQVPVQQLPRIARAAAEVPAPVPGPREMTGTALYGSGLFAGAPRVEQEPAAQPKVAPAKRPGSMFDR